MQGKEALASWGMGRAASALAVAWGAVRCAALALGIDSVMARRIGHAGRAETGLASMVDDGLWRLWMRLRPRACAKVALLALALGILDERQRALALSAFLQSAPALAGSPQAGLGSLLGASPALGLGKPSLGVIEAACELARDLNYWAPRSARLPDWHGLSAPLQRRIHISAMSRLRESLMLLGSTGFDLPLCLLRELMLREDPREQKQARELWPQGALALDVGSEREALDQACEPEIDQAQAPVRQARSSRL